MFQGYDRGSGMLTTCTFIANHRCPSKWISFTTSNNPPEVALVHDKVSTRVLVEATRVLERAFEFFGDENEEDEYGDYSSSGRNTLIGAKVEEDLERVLV